VTFVASALAEDAAACASIFKNKTNKKRNNDNKNFAFCSFLRKLRWPTKPTLNNGDNEARKKITTKNLPANSTMMTTRRNQAKCNFASARKG